jgi:hypothetical protein
MIVAVELDAFAEHLEHDLRVVDTASLVTAIPAFERLLDNPRLLNSFIENDPLDWRSRRSDREYVNRSLVLVRRPDFIIRANIWAAGQPAKPPPSRDDPRSLYLYPHDHNFALLTGGYYGPGYMTHRFEYDPDAVVGFPGETVELRPLGRSGLSRGSVMLYRPSQDVHYQGPPPELSVSISVLVPANYIERPQLLFDVESQTVERVLTPPTAAATPCGGC